MTLKFHIPGDPVAQPRPRVYKSRTVSNPARVKQWKKTVATYALQAAWEAGWSAEADMPLHLSALFLMPRPKSMPKRRADREHMVVRPDLDNLVKALKDACNEILWVDDSQVAAMSIAKQRAALGEATGVFVTVHTLREKDMEDLPF